MIDFTPKNWQNVPSASTPISAAALEDLETRVTDNAQANVAVIGEVLDLDTTGATDEASAIQTAQDNIESQGGGRLILPRTGTSGFIKLGSLVTFGHAVNVIGQGKRETVLKATAAAGGFYFVGAEDAGYSGSTNRGGESGGFHLQGNNTAGTVMQVNSCNRIIKDIRLSTPAEGGIALKLDNAQNVDFYGMEAEDGSHAGGRTTYGIVFDGGAAGCNFFGTSLNEFCGNHILFDATYDSSEIDYSNNICFFGNMIERTDTGNAIIRIKAGNNIHFWGGNVSTGTDYTPAAEYEIVDIDNSAARAYGVIGSGGSPTKGIHFSGMSFFGSLNGSTQYANVFRLRDGLQSWRETLTVDGNCTYSNCKYLARIDSSSIYTQVSHPDHSAGGGLVGWSNPSGSGKINWVSIASASSVTMYPKADFVQISGSTTITSLTATYAGHRVTLYFTSTAQVTDGSNLKLAGDFTGSGARTLSLICDGTNWVETSRSTN